MNLFNYKINMAFKYIGWGERVSINVSAMADIVLINVLYKKVNKDLKALAHLGSLKNVLYVIR